MATHIHEVVVRGEIDNSVEGRTRGWLWLLGRAEPITLDLIGDCWRDLAGTRLKFRNPAPLAAPGLAIEGVQKGLVGDMTASRKSREPACGDEEFLARQAAGEDVPLVWKNTLYLEWFAETDGRVVIEASDFDLQLGDRLWQMDEDAEEAQKLANMQAMRDFLDGVVGRPAPRPEAERSTSGDEDDWEARLEESDRLTDAYQEVLDKYMDDPDSEQKEAFVMGWDGVLDSMAAAAEGKKPELPSWQVEASGEEQEAEAEWGPEEGDFGEEGVLYEQAMDLALRSIDLMRVGSEEVRDSEDVAEASGKVMQVAAKLAAAFGGSYERELGYVLAILKRCICWLDEAGAAFERLIKAEVDRDKRRALDVMRTQVVALRGELLSLRKDLKGS